MTKEEKKSRGGLWFLVFVLLLYAASLFFDASRTLAAVFKSLLLLLKIAPILVVVLFFMAVVNFFLKPQKLKKLLGKESGAKGWLIALTAGVISHGSVYLWYPLLKEMQQHGMRPGLIASFIYSRAIKLPLLPLLVYYFGLKFMFILTLYVLIAAYIEGRALEKILKPEMEAV